MYNWLISPRFHHSCTAIELFSNGFSNTCFLSKTVWEDSLSILCTFFKHFESEALQEPICSSFSITFDFARQTDRSPTGICNDVAITNQWSPPNISIDLMNPIVVLEQMLNSESFISVLLQNWTGWSSQNHLFVFPQTAATINEGTTSLHSSRSLIMFQKSIDKMFDEINVTNLYQSN